MLSKLEAEYLKTQRLARMASVSVNGTPEVSPVSFEFDGRYFWIGSKSQEMFRRTRRYRNIVSGCNKVSVVIDDIESVKPWKPRGIRIGGTATVRDHDGIFGKGDYIQITPKTSMSWGIEPPREGGWASVRKW